MPRGHRFLWCWGPHSWGPRGAVGGPLAYPFSLRSPAARAAMRGCEKRPGLCPSRDWGPCPRVGRLSGCPGPKRGAGPPVRRGGARAMAAGTVRRAQEGAPRAASMAPGLPRNALSPAPPLDPTSARIGQRRTGPPPPHAPSPATLTPPGLRCAARLVGYGLARHQLRLTFRLWPGPRLQLRLQLRAQFRPRWFATSQRARSGLPRRGPLLPPPPPARRPRGRRGHGLGRREEGRGSEVLAWTNGEGAARSPAG